MALSPKAGKARVSTAAFARYVSAPRRGNQAKDAGSREHLRSILDEFAPNRSAVSERSLLNRPIITDPNPVEEAFRVVGWQAISASGPKPSGRRMRLTTPADLMGKSLVPQVLLWT
jgi:hypothetical protein